MWIRACCWLSAISGRGALSELLIKKQQLIYWSTWSFAPLKASRLHLCSPVKMNANHHMLKRVHVGLLVWSIDCSAEEILKEMVNGSAWEQSIDRHGFLSLSRLQGCTSAPLTRWTLHYVLYHALFCLLALFVCSVCLLNNRLIAPTSSEKITNKLFLFFHLYM